MRTGTRIAGALVLAFGCGGAAYEARAPMDMAAGAEAAAMPEMPSAGDVAPSAGHSAQASTQAVVDPEANAEHAVAPGQSLRLVYTAQLGLLVDHGASVGALDRVVGSALEMGGYLSQRNDTQVVVRVPSARFYDALATIDQLGEVTRRSVQVQDVSEEYHDLEVRIASLVALHERMQSLLERAGTLEEVLRIERELERLAREIDGARGRLRFLGSQVAWSTLTVGVSERPAPTPEEVVEEPPPPPPRVPDLPIEWLRQTGLERLLNLR